MEKEKVPWTLPNLFFWVGEPFFALFSVGFCKRALHSVVFWSFQPMYRRRCNRLNNSEPFGFVTWHRLLLEKRTRAAMERSIPERCSKSWRDWPWCSSPFAALRGLLKTDTQWGAVVMTVLFSAAHFIRGGFFEELQAPGGKKSI